MHRVTVLVLLLLLAGESFAQEVYQYDARERSGKVKCLDVAARLAANPKAGSPVLCAARRDGGPRCEVVTPGTVQQFCADATPVPPRGFFETLAAVGTDIKSGFAATAGRRAGEANCPFGLPEGELLLPGGELRVAAGSLANVTLGSDARSANAVPMPPEFAAGSGGVDAERLRGRSWILRGSQGTTPFACRFVVLGGNEARQLMGEFGRLGTSGAGALLEQALFFRENTLWFEYWQTIAALGR